LIADAVDADVTYVPFDPAAHDEYAENSQEVNLAWTLGHVIVHTTASAEEAAARASQLARGVPVEGRNRYEIPWETVTTVSQLRHCLEQSWRMRRAFLDTWPDPAHLETLYQPKNPKFRPFNAIGMFLSGLAHDDAHLEQIAEIMRQSRAARNPMMDK
jgi:hypothetical protein